MVRIFQDYIIMRIHNILYLMHIIFAEERQCTCRTQLDAVQRLVENKLDAVLSSLNSSMHKTYTYKDNINFMIFCIVMIQQVQPVPP